MALEAVVFPQDLFGLFSFGYSDHFGQEELNCCDLDKGLTPSSSMVAEGQEEITATTVTAATVGSRKKRRTRRSRDKEEVENQRMIHIAVERNRRKLMNEYLAMIRSMMPPSYVQRCDQASIVGGAINFVKELEQLLRSLHTQSHQLTPRSSGGTFPHYSSSSYPLTSANHNETVAMKHSPVADIDVTMVERHANLKVFSRQRPKQLLKIVVGLQNLRLTILHLNVNTFDQMVLYSFSLKMEEDCYFMSVDDIAAAVYDMVGKIQEEAA